MKSVKTIDDVELDQVPETRRPHIGVEIEFCSALDHEALAALILKMRWAQHVTLTWDSSVKARWRPSVFRRDRGHELAILLPAEGFEETLRQIISWIVSVGGYINSTCGLHVHLDCRHRDDARVFNRLKAAQPLLYGLVAPRRRTNPYCKPLGKRETIQDSLHGWRGIEAGDSLETVEVRMHEGTLDAERVISWIKLLQQLARGRKLRAPTANGMVRQARLTPDVRAYVRQNLNRRG